MKTKKILLLIFLQIQLLTFSQNNYPKKIVLPNKDTVVAITLQQVDTINGKIIDLEKYKNLYYFCDSISNEKDGIILSFEQLQKQHKKERDLSIALNSQNEKVIEKQINDLAFKDRTIKKKTIANKILLSTSILSIAAVIGLTVFTQLLVKY